MESGRNASWRDVIGSVMGTDNVGSASKPSWHEREISLGLQRLANARAQLASLEEQVGAASQHAVAPDDLARAEALDADISKHAAKASARFGGGAARGKVEAARNELAPLLDRYQVASVDELRARAATSDAVDPAVLDFARLECTEAERSFLEVAAMVIPEHEPDLEGDGDADAEVIAASDSFGDDDLDLRIEPSAS